MIRPAAFNGVLSDETELLARSRGSACIHLSPSLDHVGLFPRVDDVRWPCPLARGHKRGRSAWPALPAFQVDLEQGICRSTRPRIGSCRFQKFARAEPAQQKVFEATIARAREQAPSWKNLPLAEYDSENWPAINTIMSSEGAAIFSSLIDAIPDCDMSLNTAGRPGASVPAIGIGSIRLRRSRRLARHDRVDRRPIFGIVFGRAAGLPGWRLPRARGRSWPRDFLLRGLRRRANQKAHEPDARLVNGKDALSRST